MAAIEDHKCWSGEHSNISVSFFKADFLSLGKNHFEDVFKKENFQFLVKIPHSTSLASENVIS